MRLRPGFAALLALLAAPATALARDLPRSDPERAAILDAARGKQALKFVVKDLFRAGDLAYLCALMADPAGRLSRTEDQANVYIAFLLRDGGRWLVLDTGGALSKSARQVDCQPGQLAVTQKTFATQEDLAAGMREILQAQVVRDLDFGRVEADTQAIFDALLRRKLAADFSIEHTKRDFDRVMLKISQGRCATAACRSAEEKAFTSLNAWRSDPKFSSLAWGNCAYGVRASRLAAMAGCVTASAALPHCRAEMRLAADRADIDRCVADIRARCQREFPDQTIICGH